MRFCSLVLIACIVKVTCAQSVLNTDLIKILDTAKQSQTIDVLLLTKPHTTPLNRFLKQIQVKFKTNNLYSIQTDIATIKQLAKHQEVLRIEYTHHHLQVMADSAHVKNRIKPIKLGLAPLTQPFNGNGILIGIIDSGTDFNHPDFKDINGHSRIKFLWDMTKPLSSNTPSMFGYGQEWNNTEIDAGQCTHTDLVYYGHGTNSSGIAAGNGFSVNKYEGMAPNADLVVVAVDFNRPGHTIADAVQYIIHKADSLNMPCVINASLGDYYGSHDGTDLETQMINALIANTPGRAMVAAAGNGGASYFHLGYQVTPADTNFTWIRNNTNEINFSIFADTSQIKNVQYQIGVTNPALIDLANTSFRNYNFSLNTLKKDTLFYQSQRIGVILSSASINSFGVYELAITIKADSLNYNWAFTTTGSGQFDSWNFDYVSNNLPSTINYPKITHYKLPDLQQTMVSGFQCSEEIITVANYTDRNRFIDVNNTIQTINETSGQIHYTSSSGPTRDNRMKPDIAATGSNILTCLPLSMLANYIVNFPDVVAQGGFHRTAGGTSAASPVVAGLVALYLERQPAATNQQIKQAIINCAYQDNYTGSMLPNTRWGYGKLDGFATITCGETFDNVKIIETEETMKVFPNPFTIETTLLFESAELNTIKLYNSFGQLLKEDICHTTKYNLQRHNLATGVYFLVVQNNYKTYKIKLIIL